MSKVSYVPHSEEDAARLDSRFSAIPIEQIAGRVQKALPQLKLRETFAEALDRNGAGVEKIAETIAYALDMGSTKEQLKAAEIAMRSLGLFDNAQVSQGNVVFQIQGDNVNLQAVLQPDRTKDRKQNEYEQ